MFEEYFFESGSVTLTGFARVRRFRSSSLFPETWRPQPESATTLVVRGEGEDEDEEGEFGGIFTISFAHAGKETEEEEEDELS